MTYTCLTHPQPRGFALLIAVILTSVVLALGMALLDVAYKQILLSSGAKNSQYAFYYADSALECALYYDQQQGAFYFGTTYAGPIQCSNINVTNYAANQDSTTRTTTFSVPCVGGGTSADVTIIKQSSGNTSIYANGYSSCNAATPTRIERGLKAKY